MLRATPFYTYGELPSGAAKPSGKFFLQEQNEGRSNCRDPRSLLNT